jgi:hypothetical protein
MRTDAPYSLLQTVLIQDLSLHRIDKLELREFLWDKFTILSPDVDILVRAW